MNGTSRENLTPKNIELGNPENENGIPVQSRFRRKHYHKGIFGIFIIITLLLIIVIFIIGFRANNMLLTICQTSNCIQAASNFLLSMNTSVDPCENFYEYSCGNWAENHPKPDSYESYDWFRERQIKILLKIKKFLEKNSSYSDNNAINKAKIMYKTCLDINLIDKIGIKILIPYIKKFNLPLIPSLLIGIGNQSEDYDLNIYLAMIKKFTQMDILIGFDIYSDPLDHRINRIGIGTPETYDRLTFQNDRNSIFLKKAKKILASDEINIIDEENIEENSITKAYLLFVRKSISMIVSSFQPDISIDDYIENINNSSLEILRITQIMYKLVQEAENLSSEINLPDQLRYVTLNDIQKIFDEINPKSVLNLDKYINTILNQDNNITIDINNETILTTTEDLGYLEKLSIFISNTSLYNIEIYVWWTFIEEFILYTSTDFTKFYDDYMKLIIETEKLIPRSTYCVSSVSSMLGMAVSTAIIDKNFIKITQPKVNEMLNYIKSAFSKLVKNTKWMDMETKIKTLEKSNNIEIFIGYPDWIRNLTKLDKFYENINISETYYFDSIINILQWEMEKQLKSLKEENIKTWPTTPSNVNAFYTLRDNTITIPIAILQFPFYDLGLEALNYGAIGTILGHELTHGFDDNGRIFDKNGNMRQWWSNDTIIEYVNRTKCFIKQYNDYYLPQTNEHINGEHTLSENIADNGGIREAYIAYKMFTEKNGREKYLPGLQNFTHEQLFFISFGNLWCETYTPLGAQYLMEDLHCPGQIRLKGMLSNFPEFAKAFKCPIGSNMNPQRNLCRIW